jgi:rubrerythrin
MTRVLVPAVTFFSLLALATLAHGQAASKEQVIKDLQAAFNGESNAAAKYQAFAQKAGEEGFAQAAALFRAAARAEQVHLTNHAAVLKAMGVEATAQIEKPKVGSTEENLKAAIEGESYERDTMYPQFIKNARDAKQADAVKTFNLAKTAEAEHARLYSAMLAGLDASKSAAKPQAYFVCPVCGWTALSIDGKCPSCFSPKDKFIQVS